MAVSVVVALVVVGGARRAEASSCAETMPAGQIRVVVVVDTGDGGGPSAACLVVPAGTTGSQALARRAAELGAESPRYAGSGLLCAIDGRPAPPACGDRNAGGFEYWAYFNGSSGGWVYGTYNPFIRRLSDGDIEGWRYVQGAGNGSDPPPRLAPTRSLFPAIVPTTEAPVAPTAAPSGAPPGGVSSAPVGAGSPATVSPDDTSPTTVSAASVATSIGEPTAEDPLELDVATVGTSSSLSPWIPVAAVAVVILALGLGAVVRARSRA